MNNLARIPRIWIAALGVAAVALIAAFVLLPKAVLESPDAALGPLGASFAAFWYNGSAAIPSALTDLVDYWREWHAIKVLICSLLLVLTTAMALILWSRYLAAQRAGGAGSAVGGTLSTVVAVITGGVLALNVQATAVPLVALLPLVPSNPDDAAVGQSLSQLRDSLATNQATPGHEGAHQLIVDQVWQYTTLNAVIMAALAIVTGALAITLLIRLVRARGSRRTRVLFASLAPFLAISALGFLAVSALSALTALDASSTAAGLLGR